MATIVPLVKNLSKTAQTANALEEQAAYAEGLARRYGGLTVGEGVDCSSVQVALGQNELLRIVAADSIAGVLGADATRALSAGGIEGANSLQYYNRALFGSMQTVIDWGVSTRTALESAFTPFAQLSESIRQSLQVAAVIPSADVFAVLRDSAKPSGADLDAMLGRSDCDWPVAPLVPSRPKPRAIVRIERERPLTRAELQDSLEGLEARLLVKLQAQLQAGGQQSGIVVAGALPEKPPMPGSDGNTWADVFSWFYSVPRYWCPTLKRLAHLVGYSVDHVQREHGHYKAEFGERPLRYS